jgi:hypothetical protein
LIRTCDNGHPPARVLSGTPCRECERRRPSRQARGYGAAHERARALLLALLPDAVRVRVRRRHRRRVRPGRRARVDGHARIEEAISRGEPRVPVLWVDLSAEEEALVLATLEPMAAMAAQDDVRLRSLLAEVAVDDEGLAALLADLAGEIERPGLVDPDDVPEPPDAATTKRGDIWALGDHRLMCGAAGSRDDLDRLLGGATVALLATDPPYNVRVEPRSNNAIAAGLSSFSAPQTHHQALNLARGQEQVGEQALPHPFGLRRLVQQVAAVRALDEGVDDGIGPARLERGQDADLVDRERIPRPTTAPRGIMSRTATLAASGSSWYEASMLCARRAP